MLARRDLAALLEAHVPDARLSFWHEQGRHEVDFVVEVDRRVFAIEVKAATRWSEGDLSGLRAFLDRTPNCAAAVLAYNGKEAAKLEDRLWVIPMGNVPVGGPVGRARQPRAHYEIEILSRPVACFRVFEPG